MNVPKENWIDPRIEVRKSPIHGMGMFAKSDIGRGELLIVWRESYTDRSGAMEAMRQGKGTMQWDEDVFSVATDRHPEHYRINHSCDPNTWMRDAFSVEARRDVPAGEEITIDIALFESDEDSITPWACNCGSPLCRGIVTGRDWRKEEIRARYRGHFSPLLNKRIAPGQ